MRKISRVMIVGNGGRELAFQWRLKQDDPRLDVLMVPAGDPKDLLAYAREEEVGFTIVGPEAPLAKGIVDLFNEANMPIFGPTQAMARIESSKAFAKRLMQGNSIPTADAYIFTDPDLAYKFLDTEGERPYAVKADGLCAGKGVYICRTAAEARDAVKALMTDRSMGDAGKTILIEECLEGPECSVFALCDGESAIILGSAVDYKRLRDGNVGPNTGGMGSYSPVSWLSRSDEEYILERIIKPIVRLIGYRGLLYAGLMKTVHGFKVLEFNCRFGDPETQALLPRIPQGEFLNLLRATVEEGGLGDLQVRPHNTAVVCLTLAAGGYPGTPERDKEVGGLDQARRLGAIVLEASTRHEGKKVFTNGGGRVIYVIGQDLSGNLQKAAGKAYAAAAWISFEGRQLREDIAAPDLSEASLPSSEAGERELV